jgi:Family of unknown function (DUF6338)
MFTQKSLELFVLLLPGFFVYYIQMSCLVTVRKSSNFEIIITVFAHSFLIDQLKYLILAFICSIIGNIPELFENILLLFVTLLYSWIFILAVQKDWIFGKLYKSGKIKNANRETTWSDVFTDKKDKYIIVHLGDGTRLFGWPEYFSYDPNDPTIYLDKPSWIVDDKYISSETEGIMITKEAKIQFIEFVDKSLVKKGD